MKLLIPVGCLFPPGWGNVNNKLRPEKFPPSCLRTGVRFPSAPPVLLESKPSWARVSFCPFLLDLAFFFSFLCSFTRILYPYWPFFLVRFWGAFFSHIFRYKMYVTRRVRVCPWSETDSGGCQGHCSDGFPHNPGTPKPWPGIFFERPFTYHHNILRWIPHAFSKTIYHGFLL